MNKTSRGEALLRMFLKRAFPKHKHYYNVRNLGIINPKTNQQLEIDIYIPDLKIGFEFNGKQHHYDDQKEKDQIKKKFCNKNNITLINIWTNTLCNDLYTFLKTKYPNLEMAKIKREFLTDFQIEANKYYKSISKMNKKLNAKNKKQFIRMR